MATSRKKTFNQMEIGEISGDSESGLEPQFEGLNLSSTDEEDEDTYILASNARKRYASRK